MAPINTPVDFPQQGNITKSEWLNEKFFSSILRKEFGQHTIENMTVVGALPKGENYVAVIDRVTIDFINKDDEKKQISFITKTEHENLSGMPTIPVFPKEQEMYTQVVPKFEAIFKEFGENVTFAAKCYKTTTRPDSIILEDLKLKQFVNIPRHNGMDLTHAKAVLKKLSKFHAASACIYERDGPYIQILTKGMMTGETADMFDMIMKSFIPIIVDAMKSWEGCEIYVEKIKKSMPNSIKLLQKAEETYLHEFNVINHGDLWSNNIMFQYDDEKNINEVYFVDLQMSKWGSPVQDLQYFIMSSCNQETRIKEFDQMIKYYHDQLIENLKLLKYRKKLPKLVDLQIQLLKRGFFGVNTALGVLSATLAEPSDNATFESFVQDSDGATAFKKSLYTNPRYVKAIQSILPFMDNRGLLD